MRPALFDGSAIENNHLVCVGEGGETVREQQYSGPRRYPPPGCGMERGEDCTLCLYVYSGERVIEDEERRHSPGTECPGQRYPLSLPARHPDAPLADLRTHTRGQGSYVVA